ncbi:hypothetical protein PIB30_028125 [Stylosanthes scabra]|uniref:Uncharacterized protein n=1 Tax=Stylosanthes scabra TaxID=79078 RepID=A0ABU6V8Y7_9FABA|nr:hypothetical protein [Stylosanthes scabra]
MLNGGSTVRSNNDQQLSGLGYGVTVVILVGVGVGDAACSGSDNAMKAVRGDGVCHSWRCVCDSLMVMRQWLPLLPFIGHELGGRQGGASNSTVMMVFYDDSSI